MAKDYDIIKKHYGEKFAQFCRANFPTILEQGEGVLADHIMSLFAPNKSLYEDIVKSENQNKFKDYVYAKLEKVETKKEVQATEPPEDLMRKAGYTLYKCKTVADVEKFIHFWQPTEKLCTFNDIEGRLGRCHVFFAVKDNASLLNREDFKNPLRQDEYGTSVISLQFAKGIYNDVSIKNRYNHAVNNPDATFSNDLENIYPGLTDSFMQYYQFNFANGSERLELPDYTLANDKKMYKYNVEVNGNYFCPDNIIISDGNVIQLDKFSTILVGNYIFDTKNKTIEVVDAIGESAFTRTIGKISKIDVSKGTQPGGRIIKVSHDKNKEIVIEIDKNNDIIAFEDNHTTKVGKYFLSRFKNIKQINMQSLEKCLPYFLGGCEDVKFVNLPELKECGSGFLFCDKGLQTLSLPKLTCCDDLFLSNNNKLCKLNLPKLEECGSEFLAVNWELELLDLPNLKSCEDHFLRDNRKIKKINLPQLVTCGDCFLYSNKGLTSLDLPSLESCGGFFINVNNEIEYVHLPNLKSCGEEFLLMNQGLKKLSLPKLKTCEDDFLRANSKIESVYLPALKKHGQYFLYNIKDLSKVIKTEPLSIIKQRNCNNEIENY